VVSKAEMIGKIKAAVDTRRDADMVIIALGCARHRGLQAAIDRVNAYLEAGADVGFVEAPQSAEELATAARQLRKPALCNIFEGGKTPVLPARELAAMGYRIGIYPSQTHRAAIAAAKRVLAVLKRDGDTAAIEGELATFNDREEAVNAVWRDLEAKYLKDVWSRAAHEAHVVREHARGSLRSSISRWRGLLAQREASTSATSSRRAPRGRRLRCSTAASTSPGAGRCGS
jgi:hypothetical protein